MFDIKRKTLEWGGKTLTLETGRMARQADGAVLATYGETMVLATAVYAKSAKPGQDFFPLTVNYQEKFYAAGKIPGSFPRREGAPSQKETLTSRLIDRPIRPLFVKGFKNEVQVVATVLAHDLENDPDIVAMVAASAALVISGAPFMGPIAGARVGFVNGEYVLNPTLDEMRDSRMDLVVAGTHDAVMMVESEIQELADVIGDSLELARKARDFSGDVIAFCGVWFMAETAKVLNPSRTVVVPDRDAGCSLVDSCPVEPVRELHDAERLPVPLGTRHPEVAQQVLLRVAPLLVRDDPANLLWHPCSPPPSRLVESLPRTTDRSRRRPVAHIVSTAIASSA